MSNQEIEKHVIEMFKAPATQIMYYTSVSVIPLHISHIFLVTLKRKLHTNGYFILIQLCISDILLILSVLLAMHLNAHWIPSGAIGAFYTTSALFTLAINLDRYLKIKYGIRYNQILKG